MTQTHEYNKINEKTLFKITGVRFFLTATVYEELIELKNIMVSKSTNLDDFIDEVYPNISNIEIDSKYAIERTILTPKMKM